MIETPPLFPFTKLFIPMEHFTTHQANDVPTLRWRVVMGVVLAVCVAAFVAFAAWYVAAVLIPQQENARVQREFEQLQLQSLSQRMLRVETTLHIR